MAKTLPKDYSGIVEQVIRPTGLVDPEIDIRPSLVETYDTLRAHLERCGYTDMPSYKKGSADEPQIPNLMYEINQVIARRERVLVTTLTKRMAEELASYLLERDIRAKYLHSDIDTVERVEILRDLRKGVHDVLVGINLLREGLDLPEVSLVAIIDADKEGFLRSDTSLIQTIGRAARNVHGQVIMYADKVTDSMQRAIDETKRRREIQEAFNKEHGITPQTIVKKISDQLERMEDQVDERDQKDEENLRKRAEGYKAMTKKEQKKFKKELQLRMSIYADMLEFEKAAEVRDLMDEL